jgi:lipoprotein-anchoring transpeptidase ErfK/SrfK
MKLGIELKPREQILITLFFIIISFFLFFLSEILLPINETIKFDIITQSRRIFKERKNQKEIDDLYVKLQQKIRFKNDELAVVKLGTPTDNGVDFYVVVDLLNNSLILKKQDLKFNEFKVSAGNGDTLIAPWGKKWVFETPTGVLRVLRKIKDPIWYKPDWAFLEAKESIPARNSPQRLVRGILGDYALDLGGGIMFHGTPYEQLLGQRVSHGCIRLSKDGIKTLYDSLLLGAKVYIFGK